MTTIQNNPVPATEREAFTAAEFASMFGRLPRWTYTKIYAGQLQVINHGGRILIPRSEVARFAGSLTNHVPRPRRKNRRLHK